MKIKTCFKNLPFFAVCLSDWQVAKKLINKGDKSGKSIILAILPFSRVQKNIRSEALLVPSYIERARARAGERLYKPNGKTAKMDFLLPQFAVFVAFINFQKWQGVFYKWQKRQSILQFYSFDYSSVAVNRGKEGAFHG